MKTLEEMQARFDGRLNVDIECACGRTHRADIDAVLIGEGAIKCVPRLMRRKGYKTAMILADENTWEVAGKTVRDVIRRSKFRSWNYVYQRGGEVLCADEQAMYEGTEAFLNSEERADVLITVGTGTLNDLGKQIADTVGVRCWNVATAASMDGFASTVAALTRGNLKVTEYYTPPEVIIGDTAVLRTAPREMTLAGIADMAAKYNARLDWRISRLINDEYYCDFIADGMLAITDDIIDLALEAPEEGAFPDALLERLMEGLVMSGVYMSYTGTSRAASGAEHHFSHFWEMWLSVNKKPPIYHGVKVGVGSMIMADLYPRFLSYQIPEEQARERIQAFDEEKEIEELKSVYKEAAPMLLADYSYHKEERLKRLPIEVEKKPEIDAEIRAMMDRLEKMKRALAHIGARTRWEQLDNISEKEAHEAFKYCKAMRPQFTMLQLMHDTAYPIEAFEDEWIRGEIKENVEEPNMADNEVLEIKEEAVQEELLPAAEVKPEPKKRGRKPGSKNKPKEVVAKPAAKRGRPRKETPVAEEAPKAAAPAPKKKKDELPYWLL